MRGRYCNSGKTPNVRENNSDDACDDEQQGGGVTNRLHRQFIGEGVSDQHCGYIGRHHADGGSCYYPDQFTLIASTECNGRQLCLVSHFSKKKSHQRCDKYTRPVKLRIVIQRIRMQCPQSEANEDATGNQRQQVPGYPLRQPCTDSSGQPVIDQRCHEDAGNDRPGLFQSGSEDKGKQLGLVTNFSHGDQHG